MYRMSVIIPVSYLSSYFLVPFATCPIRLELAALSPWDLFVMLSRLPGRKDPRADSILNVVCVQLQAQDTDGSR